MHRLLRSLLRISIATVLAAIALTTLFAALIRQPVFGRSSRILPATASPSRLEHDTRAITAIVPRDAEHPENLDRVADLVAAAFGQAGGRVSRQGFDARKRHYQNVIGSFGPGERPAIIVGAHYDAFCETGDLPGADDNASGTAGLMELARILGRAHLAHRVDLVAYSTEEPPFFASEQMGSAVHAASLHAAGTELRATIVLEMIGTTSPKQQWDSQVLEMLYPNRGDFIAVVGRWNDRELTRSVKKGMLGGAAIPVCSFSGPEAWGIDASDHRNYWANGYEAVMVTDTAYERNRRYHTLRDTADRLDYRFMGEVVDGVANAVLHLAND